MKCTEAQIRSRSGRGAGWETLSELLEFTSPFCWATVHFIFNRESLFSSPSTMQLATSPFGQTYKIVSTAVTSRSPALQVHDHQQALAHQQVLRVWPSEELGRVRNCESQIQDNIVPGSVWQPRPSRFRCILEESRITFTCSMRHCALCHHECRAFLRCCRRQPVPSLGEDPRRPNAQPQRLLAGNQSVSMISHTLHYLEFSVS